MKINEMLKEAFGESMVVERKSRTNKKINYRELEKGLAFCESYKYLTKMNMLKTKSLLMKNTTKAESYIANAKTSQNKLNAAAENEKIGVGVKIVGLLINTFVPIMNFLKNSTINKNLIVKILNKHINKIKNNDGSTVEINSTIYDILTDKSTKIEVESKSNSAKVAYSIKFMRSVVNEYNKLISGKKTDDIDLENAQEFGRSGYYLVSLAVAFVSTITGPFSTIAYLLGYMKFGLRANISEKNKFKTVSKDDAIKLFEEMKNIVTDFYNICANMKSTELNKEAFKNINDYNKAKTMLKTMKKFRTYFRAFNKELVVAMSNVEFID